MANLPSRKSNDTGAEEVEKTVPETPSGLVFEEYEEMPSGKSINAEINPFQIKVNELAHNGKTASTVLQEDNEKWARDQIRRACNNIGKGAKTRAVPLGDGLVKIYFSVGEKSNRGRKAKTN